MIPTPPIHPSITAKIPKNAMRPGQSRAACNTRDDTEITVLFYDTKLRTGRVGTVRERYGIRRNTLQRKNVSKNILHILYPFLQLRFPRGREGGDLHFTLQCSIHTQLNWTMYRTQCSYGCIICYYHMLVCTVLWNVLTHSPHRTQLIKARLGPLHEEKERGREKCLSIHGIITVMGIMIDRFVRHPLHPSILWNNGRENIRRKEERQTWRAITIFFFPSFPFPLSLYPFFQNPFPCSRLWGMGYGKYDK